MKGHSNWPRRVGRFLAPPPGNGTFIGMNCCARGAANVGNSRSGGHFCHRCGRCKSHLALGELNARAVALTRRQKGHKCRSSVAAKEAKGRLLVCQRVGGATGPPEATGKRKNGAAAHCRGLTRRQRRCRLSRMGAPIMLDGQQWRPWHTRVGGGELPWGANYRPSGPRGPEHDKRETKPTGVIKDLWDLH